MLTISLHQALNQFNFTTISEGHILYVCIPYYLAYLIVLGLETHFLQIQS
jgi:hypothetical protein